MTVSKFEIPIPEEGINVSDLSSEIGDVQAQKTTNMRQVGLGLESIRPLTSTYTSGPLGTTHTDDLLVYRKKGVTTPEFLYLRRHAGITTHMLLTRWISGTGGGTAKDIGVVALPTWRSKLLQFGDACFVLNGIANTMYISMANMTDAEPWVAPAYSSNAGAETRTYYSTYVDTDGVESNPSPAGTLTNAGLNVVIAIQQSASPTVAKLRIYRTGATWTDARFCKEIANPGLNDGGTLVTDDSVDATVATARVLRNSEFMPIGITKPSSAPSAIGTYGSETRDYYTTFYNSVFDIESDPSPVGHITNAGPNVQISILESTVAGVDTLRVYRTGVGIPEPRLCLSIANPGRSDGGYGVVDSSTDVDVAQAAKLTFDRGKPPTTLVDGVIHNNRLFAWEADGSTLYVSNEYTPWYMPAYTFLDQETTTSGGTLVINPGDGGKIIGAASWGGSLIVFKSSVVYRVQESELGFYSYQVMSIPTTIAPRSIAMTPWGLIYLGREGFILLTADEQPILIGAPIRSYFENLTADALLWLSAVYAGGFYIVSVQDPVAGWLTFTYNGKAFNGPITSNVLYGCSYFEDIDGSLYCGLYGSYQGINQAHIRETGSITTSNTHAAQTLAWKDKAREFFPGFYSRVREVIIKGQTFGVTAQTASLVLYDENGTAQSTTAFTFPTYGSTKVGVNAPTMQRFAIGVEIAALTCPVQITGLDVWVERGIAV